MASIAPTLFHRLDKQIEEGRGDACHRPVLRFITLFCGSSPCFAVHRPVLRFIALFIDRFRAAFPATS
jgi:hypothetical protein